MAQKILLRRGGIGNIGSTIAVTKGELIFASGSSGGVENIVFIANADGNNTFTPVSRLAQGTAAANSFNSTLNGTPYYKTDSQALFILNNAGSTALDLSGNLEGTTISSITATGSFSGSFTGNGSGLTNLSLASITAPGSTTEVLFNNAGAIAATSNLKVTGTALDATTLNINTTGNITGSNLKLTGNAEISGNVVIGGNITVGDANTDFISFGGEISSSIVPDIDSAFDLGSTSKRWLNIFGDNVSGSTAVFATGISSSGYLYAAGALDIDGNATIAGTLAVATGISSSTYLYAGGNLDVEGTSTLTGNTTVGATLTVTTGVSSSGYLYAGGNLDVDGNTDLTGTLTVGGQTNLNGNINLGDAATDVIAFKADVSSSIIPSVNATFNIGGPSDKWLQGYFVSASIDSLLVGGVNPMAMTLDDVMNNGNTTNNDFVLNNNGNQSITHTGATGNLSISSQNGSTLIEGTTFAGNNVTIPGNLTVQGTTTTIDSTTVNIGDNIIVLNAVGTVADGGIQVVDTTGTAGTGSLLWNATSDYWYAGVSGSTHYRLTTYDNASPAANSIQKVDSNGRLVASLITDNGSIVTVAGAISGSTITASTGFVATGLTGVIDTSSRVIFRDGSNRLGALANTDSAIEVSTLVGYKADGTFVATSVIDGGTF
jgi:predicted acyltransferase (DUF342 family)